ADFDDVAYCAAFETAREQLEKGGEAGFVERRTRGELPQDRPELGAQFEHATRKETVERGAGRRQVGAVGREARTLYREDGIVGCLVVPAAKTRGLLRAIEGAVDLYRGDLPAGVRQLTRLLQTRRIKDAAPRRIDPAADADPDL